MKFLCVAILVALSVAEISAGTGFYVPKAYYFIDENGQASPVYSINDAHKDVLARFRRSPQLTSSSSSSSSSSSYSSDGGPVYFQQNTAVHNSGQGQGYGGAGAGLGSRFGGDDSDYTSHGVQTHTSGVVDKNGKVHYNTQTQRF